MNKKECENQILEKLKEIKAIAKKYDESEELYLSISIHDDFDSLDKHLEINMLLMKEMMISK